jgi:hypothetical protein
MRPRTKHIALKYHHFSKHVADGTVSVVYVETGRLIADALGDVQFCNLRKNKMLIGW